MIACRKARVWILRARDGELGLERDLELQVHLAECADCRALDESSAALEEALTRLPEPPVDRVDVEAAVARVRERCERDDRERGIGRRRLVRRLVAAAALVLLVGSAVLRPWERGSAPAVGGGELAGAPEVLSLAPEFTPVEEQTRGSDEVEVEGELVVLLEPAPLPEPLDQERIESSRERTRAALAEAFGSHPIGVDAEDFARAVDALARPLESEGWPVARLVERFVDDPDRDLAQAAVRYLGLRGDRLSARKLARRLGRGGAVVQDLPLRRALVLALADAGEDGLSALRGAAGNPELAADVMQIALAVGGERAAERVVDVIEAWGKSEGASEDLDAALRGLAQLDSPGFDALVDLGARSLVPAEHLLSAFERVRGGRGLLVLRVREGPARRDVDTLLRAAGRLGAEEVLDWVEECCLQREHRVAALDGLVELGSSAALDVLLALRDEGRLTVEDVCASFQRVERAAPGTLVTYALRLQSGAVQEGLTLMQDVLLEAEDVWAGAGLVALARSPLLDEERRVWAALAVGEVGAVDQLANLSELLTELGPSSKRLAAACLLSVHTLGAAPAVQAVLADLELAPLEEILSLLERRTRSRNLAAPMSKLARRLEPWLESVDPDRRRTTP